MKSLKFGKSILVALIVLSLSINLVIGDIDLTVTVVSYQKDVLENIPTTIDAKNETGVVLEDFNSTEPATVTISLYEKNPHSNATIPPDSPMAMGIYLEINTNATKFATTIKVFYTHEDLDGIEESSLRLYYFSDPEWVQCNITGVNTVENYIWAYVTHFTIFAPFGTEVEPEPEPSPWRPRPVSNKLPVANAGPDQTVYVAHFVEFSGVNSSDIDGYIISYSWDFGDGVNASGVNVTHRYLMLGNYTVILTVKDNRYEEDTDTCTITVIEHVIPTPLLPPYLDNLNITPAVVEFGDSVTISFDIRNMDSQSINYRVDIYIGNVNATRVWIKLGGYEFKTVSHIVTPDTIGIYIVMVHGLTGGFVVEPEITPEPEPTPAEFVVSNLTVTPSEVEPGEGVEISLLVRNIGEQEGSYMLSVLIENGQIFSWTGVTDLDGGTNETVRYKFKPEAEGNYTVEFNDLIGRFMVKVPPTPAEFVWANFTYVSEIQEGEPFELSIDVLNVGETAGEATMITKIDGEIMTMEIDGETVNVLDSYLEAGGGSSIHWTTFHLFEVGTHKIQLNGFEGTFEVISTSEPIPFWQKPGFILATIIIIGIGIVLYWRKTKKKKSPF